MVRKVFLTILAAAVSLFCPDRAKAQSPVWRFGAEWGWATEFLSVHRFSFITDDGMRVGDTAINQDFTPTCSVAVNVIAALAGNWELSLHAGAEGNGHGHIAAPLTVRSSYFPSGNVNDGVFAFAEAGFGFIDLKTDRKLILAKAGSGYRYMLNRSGSLDIMLNLQLLSERPELWDDYDGSYVPEHSILTNMAAYCALKLSLALNF